MPVDAVTLPDMLSKVPALLSSCLSGSEGRGAAIRVFRLVSKEVGCIALRELKYFEVKLGDGACPQPKQAVQLVQLARLKTLVLHISTTSGRTGPSLVQQLGTCTSQMTELVQGVGQALASVDALTLKFDHAIIRSSGHPRACNSSKSSSNSSNNRRPHSSSICPPSFACITRAVCSILAAALPSLKTYNVLGCCMDAALDTFGASCPLLTRVEVEAVSVPIKALRDLGTGLPNLTKFQLKSPSICPDSSLLSAYVGRCLDLLQPSLSLKCLVLDYDATTCLECKPGQWSKAPPNVHTLFAQCALNGLQNTPALTSNLTFLYMNSSSSLNLLGLLQSTPNLKMLMITGPSTPSNMLTLHCNESDTMLTVSLLTERMLGGLIFVTPRLGLDGTCESVQAVMAALSPLPETRYLAIDFDHMEAEVPDPDCLAHVRRVCPNLAAFTVAQFNLESESTWTGNHLLGPLEGCATLQHLVLFLNMSMSTSELQVLCLSMPELKSVRILRGWLTGAESEALEAQFNKVGRVIKIQLHPIIKPD